ncbi:MAG: aldose epimerase family protein [Clostridia bacterium]
MDIFSKEFFDESKNFIATIYTLINKNGSSVKITNFGATILEINVPDKLGDFNNVVAGFNKISKYTENVCYFGATVGRCANRISNGHFAINNVDYYPNVNNGANSLHGGKVGFDKKLFTMVPNDEKLVLHYLSENGEESYPGNLDVNVVFSFDDDNCLTIEYFAKSDKDTLVNLTNHSYFNLTGFKDTIEKSKLYINADYYTPLNQNFVPTGEILAVKGTAFDFKTPKVIATDLYGADPQILLAGGYDHNYVLNNKGDINVPVAAIKDMVSGRCMEVYTTMPGMQLYTGNALDGTLVNANGTVFKKNSAVCFETQHFPNAINTPNFPSPILKKDEVYNHITKYRFSVNNNT